MVVDPKAGNATKLFEIDTSSWIAIFKRIFWVTSGRMAGDFYEHYSSVPHYEQLVQECLNWRNSVYPRILQYAQMFQNSAPQIAICFSQMRKAITNNCHNLVQVEESINDLHRKMTGLVSGLIDEANAIDQMIAAFGSLNEQADSEVGRMGGFDGSWQLGSHHDALWDALDQTRDHWNALTKQLDALYEMLNGYIREDLQDGDIESLADDLTIAERDWNQAAQMAQVFHQSQVDIDENHYYSGDFIYDLCIIDENGRYRLTTGWAKTYALDVAEICGMHFLVLYPVDDSSTQRWKFTRAGYGWYKLSNDFTGPEWSVAVAVDCEVQNIWELIGEPFNRDFVVGGGPYLKYLVLEHSNKDIELNRQYWRLIPTVYGPSEKWRSHIGNYVLMVNLWLGHTRPIGSPVTSLNELGRRLGPEYPFEVGLDPDRDPPDFFRFFWFLTPIPDESGRVAETPYVPALDLE